MKVEVNYIVGNRVVDEIISNVKKAERVTTDNTDYFHVKTENKEFWINMEYVYMIVIYKE